MSAFQFTIEGKNAFLDVYSEFCIARKPDGTTRTVTYNEVTGIEFQPKQFLTDSFIRIELNSGKNIRFHVKRDASSQTAAFESAESMLKMIAAVRAKDIIKSATPVVKMSEPPAKHYNEKDFRKFKIKVAGVTFKNDDGTKRQEIIEYLSEGEPLEFVIGEFKGKPSVRIDSDDGTIGFVPQEKATEIANKIKHGIFEEAYIENIYGGDNGKSYGVSVMVVVKNQSYNYRDSAPT